MSDYIFKQFNGNAIFSEYTGQEHIVTVPDSFESIPITCIGAKSFLSCKCITELTLPDTIDTIEAWAFAHMKNLTTLTIPAKSIILGKDAFLDCPSLAAIYLSNDSSNNPGTPFFLAYTVTKLQNLSLFLPDVAGSASEHKLWMKQFDESLFCFVQAPDDEGFQPVFYGWFNDEDAELTQRPAYRRDRQEAKIEMILTRLLYPLYLADDKKSFFKKYIEKLLPEDIDSTNLSQNILWQLFLHKYSASIEYFDILLESGCFKPKNISSVIENLKDTNPEITARLLNYQMEQSLSQNHFEEFNL